MSGRRAVRRWLLSLFAPGVLLAGCATTADEAPSLLPTLAPTRQAEVTPPEAGAGLASFPASSHEEAMRPGHAGDLADFAGATRYRLDVDISPAPHTIAGWESVRYVNSTGDTLEEVVFRLYPNHLMGREALRVEDVRVGGAPVEPELSAGATVLVVPLPVPLSPGRQVEISMTFSLAVPPDEVTDTYGRLGDLEGVLSLPSFFPLLSVYDQRSGKWWREQPSLLGDPVYSESALFEVRLTAPDEAVVASVGQTLSRSDNGDSTADYQIVTGPVRDFALYLSDDYEVLSETAEGVQLNVYSLPGGEDDDRFALEAARRALEIFDDEFGEYPFAELDVVETPTLAGGIEYPGLFVAASSVWDKDEPFFEVVIAHETAHQWWYSLVGNDQVSQPWLDEGMAQYAVELYLRRAGGEEQAQDTRRVFSESIESYLAEGGEDMPIGLPVTAYTDRTYQLFVYYKAPLFFDLLEERYGREAMRDFLHAYFEAHEYGLADASDLQRAAEQVFGEDLDPLFDEWVGQGR